MGRPLRDLVNAGWRMPFTKLMCKRPPYGGIRAIDIATGKTCGTIRSAPRGATAVQHPDAAAVHDRHAQQRRRGHHRQRPDLHRRGDRRSAARDRRAHGQGGLVGPLPAGGQATPIIYQQDGREYLVIFAGGHHFMETPVGDSVIAYALPQR